MLNPIRVISLDRTPERFTMFQKFNFHLPIQRVSACEGGEIKKEEYIESGIFSGDLEYSVGAMGIAVSHIRLWQEAVSENSVRHVAEDDAIIRNDFYQIFAEADVAIKGWDIFLWGYNDDWPVGLSSYFKAVVSLEGKAHSQDFISGNYSSFQLEERKPSFLPLASAAGIGLYSVSPQGAQKLLDKCLPLANHKAKYAKDTSVSWSNTGLDVEMSRHYEDMNAYLSFPPMALMINDMENSTIRGSNIFK
ncbi:glycosyltransferase family 25 protein [Acetobacter farinalis]|uniref:Glycosyltransferase family 25 protein n=1 Tax=Acetobacter farinalis TaxID=1260984 RepID=A0ABT3QAM1_9PROT|nr:glycosyltransferase family 25 protein [Acetobacter farinalis]MCX2562343.1 glycosyltransferase family 25 protein [Acetobacter farinalis]